MKNYTIIHLFGWILMRTTIKTIKRASWFEEPLPSFEGKKVLDVGCSYNKRSVYASSYKSLDINPNTDPNFVLDICQKTPLRSNSFDIILGLGLLEHVESPEKAVKEMVRLLKKGGKIYLNVPFMYPEHGKTDFHRFTIDGMMILLKENNLTEIKTRKKHAGFFSVIFTNLIFFSYGLPFIPQRIVQAFAWVLLKFFKHFDFGREHYYRTFLIVGQKL